MNVEWTAANWPLLLAAMLAGFGLGLFFFGGLWWTTQRVAVVRSPGVFVLVSFVGRTLVTLLGFYLIMGGSWQRLVLCTAGFILARVFLVRRLGVTSQEESL